jgi:transketolase
MHKRLLSMKRTIIQASFDAQEGHIPSAFSVLDILWVLYDKVLNHDPSAPQRPDRDRFVLSKGHASLGLYAMLAEAGYFPAEEIGCFASFGSMLGGHPCRRKVPGVESSTGSLGHGFPMAVGMAMALRLQNLPSRVFTLIGDGEANEGSVWEAALLASHHRLDNLCLIVDYNHSTDRALGLGDLAAKFACFGFDTESIDGHGHEAIFQALSKTAAETPRAVIARTVKGKGCPAMENNPAWHHRAPKAEELAELLESLS